MFHLRHDASFAAPIASVYQALLAVLARRRWADEAWFEREHRPVVGQQYVTRTGAVVRRGRVVECSQPVRLTLYETLFDPPCRVRLRLRWRLEPSDRVTALRLDTAYELNRPASLNRKRWREQLDAHCVRLHVATAAVVGDAVSQPNGVSGHSSGNSSMTVAKTTKVSGSPIFK